MLGGAVAVGAALQQVVLMRSQDMLPLLPTLRGYVANPETVNPDIRFVDGEMPPGGLRTQDLTGRASIRALAAQACVATAGLDTMMPIFRLLDGEGRVAAAHAIASELVLTGGKLEGSPQAHTGAARFIQNALIDPADCEVFASRGLTSGLLAAASSSHLDQEVRVEWAKALSHIAITQPDSTTRAQLLESLARCTAEPASNAP